MQKEKNNMISIICLIIYVLASSLGMILIKKGGAESKLLFTNHNFECAISWVAIVGIILYVISFLIWIYILNAFTLTYISPIAYGLVYISIAIFSYYILGVALTKAEIVGAFFIITGIFIANLKIN